MRGRILSALLVLAVVIGLIGGVPAPVSASGFMVIVLRPGPTLIGDLTTVKIYDANWVLKEQGTTYGEYQSSWGFGQSVHVRTYPTATCWTPNPGSWDGTVTEDITISHSGCKRVSFTVDVRDWNNINGDKHTVQTGNVVLDDIDASPTVRFQGKTNTSGGWTSGWFATGHHYNYTTWIDGDQSRYSCVQNCTGNNKLSETSWYVKWKGLFYEKLRCEWYYQGYPNTLYACTSGYYTHQSYFGDGTWNQDGTYDGVYPEVWLTLTPWATSIAWQTSGYWSPPAGYHCQAPSADLNGRDDSVGTDKYHAVKWECIPN